MSKTDKKKNNKLVKKQPEERDYKNPMESTWGKILIWILVFGMLGIVVIGSIWAIIEALIN